MSNQLEHATQEAGEQARQFNNPRVAAQLDALRKLQALGAPCSRCRRAKASTVLGLGTDHAMNVCRGCADHARLDQRVAQQRAERAAMGRR